LNKIVNQDRDSRYRSQSISDQ
jgi:hypothetical protein